MKNIIILIIVICQFYTNPAIAGTACLKKITDFVLSSTKQYYTLTLDNPIAGNYTAWMTSANKNFTLQYTDLGNITKNDKKISTPYRQQLPHL